MQDKERTLLLWVDAGEVTAMAMQPPVDESVLQISERTDGAIAYVQAAGEIDIPGEKALRRTVDQLLAQGIQCIIFDLRQVRYMDTGALEVLMGAKSGVIGDGGEVYVLVDEPLPKRVIYMAHLQGALRLCDTVDEALADIAHRATQSRPGVQVAPHARLP